MVLLHSHNDTLDMKMPDFSLPATNGNTISSQNFSDKKALVVLFICNHCPYVKAIHTRLNALADFFQNDSVQIMGINANDSKNYPDDDFEHMKQIDFSFPYLHDESQEVAKSFGAVCTPDIFVFDEKRILKYRGRLDDNWQDGSAVTQEDLKNAIHSLLKGETPENQIPSMGCSIKWKV